MRIFRQLFSLLFLLLISHRYSAQTVCAQAQPLCAGVENIFPAVNGTVVGQAGPNYNCVGQPNRPSWHTLQVGSSGSLSFTMSAGADIDFVCWGPFTSPTGSCSATSIGTNVVGCGFSGSPVETFNIPAAVAGQFYILVITNFNDVVQTVTLTQSGTGSLNCSNVCDITGVTHSVSTCMPGNTYSVTGTVNVNGVPTVGSMTITNSCGGSPQVFNAPFPSPLNYTFTNLPANGSTCSITANFYALTTCSLIASYTAPNTPSVNIASSSNPVCTASPNVTLTASGASTYTWNTGTNGSTLGVTPVLPTTIYTVTGTSSTGCTATASISQTLSTSPILSPFAIPSTVCSGASATLACAGAIVVTWQPGSLSGPTVAVNPTVPTTYTVTGTVGVCSTTATVFVNVINGPTMTATTNTALICPGNSATLTANGSSALSYTWYPGGTISNTLVVTPSVTTTYSVVGVNAFGCTSTVMVTQPVSPNPTVMISPASPSFCAGSSITLTATGANTYTWNPGTLSGSMVVVNPPSNTNYTVVGSNGTCTNSTISSVTVVPLPNVTASASSPTVCSGLPVSLIGGGATTYSWMPGSLNGQTVTVNPTVSTTYTVTGSSAGCSNTATVSITVINGPALTAVASPTAICPGNFATLTANGAVAYTWTPGGANTSTISVSPPSTTLYTVTGANAAGCLTNTFVNLVVNPVPSLIATAASPTICSGSSTTLSASGGVSYTWTPGGSTATNIVVTPSVTTTYTLNGANAAGCSSQTFVTVTVISLPIVGASSNPTAVCAGSSATLTGTGATSYVWNPGGLSGVSVVVTPSSNTTYTVTGTNSGCTNTAAVTVLVNNNPSVGALAFPATICSGGSSTLVATGAATYVWSTGATTNSIVVSPSVTTIYTVTGTNAAGCSTTRTVQVTISPAPGITITPASPTICAGQTVSLSASGASTYTWSPGGQTSANISVTPSTTTVYTVNATSAFGCVGQQTAMVTVVPLPTVGASSNPTAVCAGSSATLTGTGATSYAWNPGGLTGSVVVVTPSLTTTYTLTGTNSGCSNTTQVTVVVNGVPTIAASAGPSTVCPGGSSTLTATGATAYTWNPGGMTSNPVTVTPSITTVYTVTGSNGSGCTATKTVAVTVSTPPTVLASASSPSMCAGNSVTLSASGASAYTWTPGGQTATNIVVSPSITTTYTLTGANGIGCTNISTVTIFVIPSPAVGASSNPTAVCAGSSATLTGTGATSYVWNPGPLSGQVVVVTPSLTTTYTVTGTSSGCTNTAQVTVTVNSNPSLSLSALPATVCPGGSSTLTASGAAGYVWNPGGMTSNPVVVTPSITTVYTVTGTNGFGCTAINTVTVTLSTLPTVLASASSPTMCAGNTVTLTASGAAAYTWTPGGQNATVIAVSPSITTTYTLTGANGVGCTNISTVTIVVIPVPAVGASANPTAVCSGASATLTGSGATSYVWNPGALNGQVVIVTPSLTTTYTLTGTNSGCTNTAQVTVIVNPTPVLAASANPSVVCLGGSSTLTASGAFAYSWSPGGATGSFVIVTPSVTTVYTVTGTSIAGCISTKTVSVGVSLPPTLGISASSPSLCAGSSVTLTASGAPSYTWLPGGQNATVIVVSPSVSTTYTLKGATAAGCTSQTFISIFVAPVPAVTASATPNSICAGSSSTLNASGASSYIWQPGGLSGPVVVVTPLLSTNYTLTASNGGCSATAIVSVTVNNFPTVLISSSSPSICSGTSATLTASGTATSFTWNPGGSTATAIVVSPLVNTVYSLVGSNSTGCTSVDAFSLVVGSPSTITATASSPTICQGFTTALNASGATAGTYTWNPGGIVGSIITVTPATSTNYTVLNDNGSCIASATIAIVVIPAPIITATATPPGICPGGTVTLSASGALTYTWIPGFLAGQTVTDSPAASTDYTVAGFAASGCPNFAIVSVTVFGTPTVGLTSNPPTLCTGDVATLTPSGATSYTLSPGGLSGTSFTVNPTTTTSYTLIGDNGGCASGSAIFNLTVNPIPTVQATASSGTICSGSTVSLSATGAANYTWNPVGLNGSNVTDTPPASIIYTVVGADLNGCTANATVGVQVNPSPVILIAASSDTICQGAAVTLTATGAGSYTWSPLAVNTDTATDTPASSTTYTVSGSDAIGCTGTNTILITVVTTPTLNVTPTHSVVCAGSPITFTATGATNYTWLPSGVTTDTDTEIPTAFTTYTVIGSNGGTCTSSFIADVSVNPVPDNVTASASGSITCATPSVDLMGSSTTPSVSYSWAGPLSYTSSVQNPTGVTVWGIFTLTVSDDNTGCTATTTLDVLTDNSIPLVNITSTGSITCAANTVTLIPVNTTTNPGYFWQGPGGFTSIEDTITTTLAGDYTVTVLDLTSTCKSSATITIGTHTRVVITASITPATCNGETANNDGTILVANFGALDKFDLVPGPTYTGSANYASASLIPSGGIITSNLANPTTTLAFTIRLFDTEGCTKDTTLILQPVDCVPKTLGIAKAASDPVLNDDGTYQVTYTVVVKNYDSNPVSNVSLDENLAVTFPLPTTYTVSTPVISAGSNLALNSAFDGTVQTSLTDAASSGMAGGETDTIVFTVKLLPNGFFGPFNNFVTGSSMNSASITVRDSSTAGLDPDPDGDHNPLNNTYATIINLTPKSFFGITKIGTVNPKLRDGSYDITYGVTVHNLGNDTLYNVVLKDSLFENTIKSPATYVVRTAPISDGYLIANAAFDGKTDINLVSPLGKIPPGTSSTIMFIINVNPDTVTVVKNSAYGNCLNRNNRMLSDTSNAGTNPDSNDNGIWNEPADNVPTVLSLVSPTLFIPEGFSPDGDNINDIFYIPGLPTTGDNVFTVYNRWGNKVYYSANYDNTWRGYPNVSGIIGSNRLPQGTYYYILDMKGSGMKPVTGFIVLQY